MIIGIAKEIKNNEYRVCLVPADVQTLTADGHQVLVEQGAGVGSGFSDDAYKAAGATIVGKEVYTDSDIFCKVKEIEPEEYPLFRPGQIVFSYLHSNAHPEMTQFLLDNEITAICYEDIDDKEGKFPLLIPMSIFAGKGGFIAALQYSQTIYGGSGKILSNIPGIETPHITIIGAGYSGMAAAKWQVHWQPSESPGPRRQILQKAKQSLPPNVEFLSQSHQSPKVSKRPMFHQLCSLAKRERTISSIGRISL